MPNPSNLRLDVGDGLARRLLWNRQLAMNSVASYIVATLFWVSPLILLAAFVHLFHVWQNSRRRAVYMGVAELLGAFGLLWIVLYFGRIAFI